MWSTFDASLSLQSLVASSFIYTRGCMRAAGSLLVRWGLPIARLIPLRPGDSAIILPWLTAVLRDAGLISGNVSVTSAELKPLSGAARASQILFKILFRLRCG
eukprot:m.510902 g.510902  ORF g.510902 m.510902 type:complete len:103 (+) comp57422_c0_seq8:138-446(+)